MEKQQDGQNLLEAHQKINGWLEHNNRRAHGSLGYLTHLELSAALGTLRGGGRQRRRAQLNLEIVGGSLSPPGAHQNTFWKANLHRGLGIRT